MVDFQLIWDLRVQNAQQARQELNQTADAFARGEKSAEEMNLAIRKYERSASETIRTQRAMNNEWKIAHPNLAQFSRGVDAVASSAYRLKSIYDTINIALIRQNTATGKNAELLNQKAILSRQLADIQSSPDFDPTKPTQKYLELQEQVKALDAEMAKNGQDTWGQIADFAITAAIVVPNAVKAVTDLAVKWDKVGTAVQTVNKVIRGTAALSTLTNIGIYGGLAGAGIVAGAFSAAAIKAQTEHMSFEEALTEIAENMLKGQAAPGSVLNPDKPFLKSGGESWLEQFWGGVQKWAQEWGFTPKPAFGDTTTENAKKGSTWSEEMLAAWGMISDNSKEASKSSDEAASSMKDTKKSIESVGLNWLTISTNITSSLTAAWQQIQSWARGSPSTSSTVTTPTQTPFAVVTRTSDISGPASTFTYKGLTGIAAERAAAIGFAGGGTLFEPVVGIGQRTGQMYTFAENGPEEFLGSGSAAMSRGSITNVTYVTSVNVQGSVITEQKLAEIVSREQAINYRRRFS